MREHVVSEYVRREDASQPRLRRLCSLRRGDHPHGGYLVREPRYTMYEVCEGSPDCARPVDPCPAADAGVEDDGVEFRDGGCESLGEGADGGEGGEVDGFGVEGYSGGLSGGGYRWEEGLEVVEGRGGFFGAPGREDYG